MPCYDSRTCATGLKSLLCIVLQLSFDVGMCRRYERLFCLFCFATFNNEARRCWPFEIWGLCMVYCEAACSCSYDRTGFSSDEKFVFGLCIDAWYEMLRLKLSANDIKELCLREHKF